MKKSIVAIAYIPVLHKGYVDFCATVEAAGATDLYLIGDEILVRHAELDYINRKDRIRAVEVGKMVSVIESASTLKGAILDEATVSILQTGNVSIVTPNEDIGRVVVKNYFPDNKVEYIDIFLRFNRENVNETKPAEAETVIKVSEFQEKIIKDIIAEADKSFDWWRQVGAALVRNGEVLVRAYNEHLPEAQTPNIIGDARSLFTRGVNINYVTSAHAEVGVIAEAARQGLSTNDAELYVTDFPCPYCARLIAKSGIKRVYFLKGYAVLDGEEFFKEAGLDVVRIIF